MGLLGLVQSRVELVQEREGLRGLVQEMTWLAQVKGGLVQEKVGLLGLV